jgi:hypothetical protein
MGILSSIFGCNTPGPSVDSNDTIVYFSLSQGGGMMRFSGYKFRVEETKDGRVHFLFNEDYPDELEFTVDDHSVFDSLQQIILKYKMYNYTGHYEPEERIFDGQSWSLYVKYASGASISAGGYMAGPDGYWAAFDEISDCLEPWKNTPVAKNDVVSFDYRYGPKHFHIEGRDDHAEVTVDDGAGNHEVIEKPLEIMEELRLMAITEGLRENGGHRTDDPNSTPFRFELVFSNGDHYAYESYDTNYQCHYTEVIQWFLRRHELLDN